MERDGDGSGYNSQIDGETQPGEKSALVGEMVACVGRGVFENECPEKGAGEKEWACRGVPVIALVF